jgi:hypothetical protein
MQGVWAFNWSVARDSWRAARAAPWLIVAVFLIHLADYPDEYLVSLFGEDTPAYWTAYAVKGLIITALLAPVYVGVARYILLEELPQRYFLNLNRGSAFRRTLLWSMALSAIATGFIAMAFLPFWFGVYATPFTLIGIVGFLVFAARMAPTAAITALDVPKNAGSEAFRLTAGHTWRLTGMALAGILLVLYIALPAVVLGIALAIMGAADDIDVVSTVEYIGLAIALVPLTALLEVFFIIWGARVYKTLSYARA